MNLIITLRKYQHEIIGSLLCLALGMLSGYLSHSGPTDWYEALHKPSYTPAHWVFSPVWIILYCMMGTALGKLWKTRHQHPVILYWFGTQLWLNVIWSPLFFGMQRIDLALWDILLLWGSLVFLLAAVHKMRTIFLLLVPYFLWVSFAAILNFNIYLLNV